MKLHIILLLALFAIFSCSEEEDSMIPLPEQTWSYAGLGQYTVEEIKIVEEQLWAATQDGMFKKTVNAEDTSWIQAGLQGLKVTDFVAFSGSQLLAAVELGPENQENTLYATDNGGESWAPLQSDFGGEQGSQTCYALGKNPEQPTVIYARGAYNVAKSADRGENWESVFGEWNLTGYQADLIQVDTRNTDIVWAGGETSIFSPYLIKSTDAGQSWQPMNIPSGGDNAVYSLAIDPGSSDHVLVGMEGQIIATQDGGSNWEVIFSPENYSYINDLQVSLMDEQKVYAAGTDGGTDFGSIIIYVSEDFGSSWEAVRHQEAQYAALDLALYSRQGQELVYVGTNRGVFIYQP